MIVNSLEKKVSILIRIEFHQQKRVRRRDPRDVEAGNDEEQQRRHVGPRSGLVNFTNTRLWRKLLKARPMLLVKIIHI